MGMERGLGEPCLADIGWFGMARMGDRATAQAARSSAMNGSQAAVEAFTFRRK